MAETPLARNGDLRRILRQIADGKTLPRQKAAEAFMIIMMGAAEDIETAAFLSGLASRGETVEELIGVVSVLRDAMERPGKKAPSNATDICGTGGDGSGMFNVSTAAAIVAAGAGASIAKHCGRAASSSSGSADVLSELGLKIDATPAEDACGPGGLIFLYAPMYHPALARIAPIRRTLGFRTIVNLAAPLANPMRVQRQVVGVARRVHQPLLASALSVLGTEHALIVNGENGASGVDEITTTGITHVVELKRYARTAYELTPEQFGLQRVKADALLVSGPSESADIIRRVLAGESGPHRDIVLLNAAAAVYVGGIADTIADGFERAEAAIDTGAAHAMLKRLVS